ncbi:unnamed protein product [Cladocopium goreaui]|uniref:Reverse transcriptase domain-containing protein n=1 Tax=Cladocopium goreaui TaxID=2562237 RepID=A0A9P1BQT3_9DINO|nr:unnamed protein product [Cladocopium goreaui]
MGGTEVHCTFPESTTKWTKRHGMQPPMCNRTLGGPDTAHGNSKVEKRSLLRAYKRSLTVGSAWYRGKHYTSDTLERMGCRLRSPTHAQPLTPGLQSDWQKCNSKHGSKGRIKFWQWNSGGLASHTMDEVKAWLVMNCVDIGIIVETRLSFDSHWTDKHWHHIHSGEGGNRGKGILILISKRMCQMNQLRWQIHDSGRLIHLRMQLQPRAIDLVACYQHTFQATRRNQQARDQWWTLLAQVLSGLPNRHCLILAGDFNCSVPASPGCVGTSKFAWRGNNVTGTYHGDHPKFLQILRDNALTVLNSWTASAGPTYVHCDQASRIDHICVRQSYADGEAKNVQHLWHSPFLNQTEVGHVPLLTTIAKYWIPDNRSDKIHNVTLQQRQMSRQAFLSQSDTWREFTTVSQQLLLDHLRAPVPDADAALQSLHREMLSLQFARPPGVPFSLQQLEKALSLIPVTKATAKPFEIIQLLAYWHEATDYFVQHDLDTTQIPIGRGVRQGCKAAPGLWNSFMVLLLHDLNMHIPLSWIQNCLTIYADDFHVGTSFTCMEEFCLFHHFIGILFLTMQSLDMSINPGKSVALIELRGSESKAARARFVRRDHNGDSLKIIIPGGAAIHIPICKSTKYLGVIISYGSFEDCSLKHRLKLMHVGFRRLQRWLTGKHSLSQIPHGDPWTQRPDNGVNFVFSVFLLLLIWFNTFRLHMDFKVEDQWIEACFDGKMTQVLQSAATRMRLTVVCQACNKGCKRAADLALQLAMSYHRAHREPFAPMLITDMMLQAILSAKLPRAPKYRLEQALVHRQFADTWQDPELLQFLRTYCLYCGHQTHTSDLALHLREEHACGHNTCLFYMEQLLPTVHALNPDDYQCQLCGLIFNLPVHLGTDQPAHDRIVLALSHLKGSCPTLLQLSLLFGALLHGRQLRHGDGGHLHHQSDAGGFWSHHAHAGQESQPDAQSETLQGPSKRRHRPRGRGSTGHTTTGDQAHDADDAADGSNGGQTRSRMEQSTQNRSIHSFLNPDPQGALHQLVQETAQWKQQMENPSKSQMRPLRQHLILTLLQTLHTNAGKIVESKEQDPLHQTSVQKGLILADKSFPFHRWDAHTQKLLIDKKQPVSSQKMFQHLTELQEMVLDRDLVVRFHALKAVSDKDLAAVPWRLQINLRNNRDMRVAYTSELAAAMQKTVSGLIMQNDRNWCYINSVMYGLLWTLLCLDRPAFDLWGAHGPELVAFLIQHSCKIAVLADIPWLAPILRNWGPTQEQKDCAECAQKILTWLAADAFDMGWERRLDTCDGFITMDVNSACTPIILTFTRDMHTHGSCTFSGLISSWSQENSMQAALKTASPCICLQLDRHYQDEVGNIFKTNCAIELETEVAMPVFTQHDLQTEHVGYIPIAGVAHLGMDRAGHCRSIMKIQPSLVTATRPAAWLTTEDDERPTPTWDVPAWFKCNAALIWLVRTDMLNLMPQNPLHTMKLLSNTSCCIFWSGILINENNATDGQEHKGLNFINGGLATQTPLYNRNARSERQSQQEAVCKYDITPFQRFPVHSKHLRDLRQPSLENLIKVVLMKLVIIFDCTRQSVNLLPNNHIAEYKSVIPMAGYCILKQLPTGSVTGLLNCTMMPMRNVEQGHHLPTSKAHPTLSPAAGVTSHYVVTSSAQFKLTLHRIGQTLDILEDAKLSINLEKTFALMRLVLTESWFLQRQRHSDRIPVQPDIEEVEHRVRVQELLQYARGDQITPVRSALVCQHCGKVYTTRHGLLQHARRYHRAEQAVEEATALDIDMQCQIYQAVTLNACEDLLLQEDIQHFLSTRCLKCQKTYAGRRALSRHIKQNHASEWHECELRAMQLDIQWKPIYGCVCKPTMHTKHICQMYLQFILLRLDHERQMMPLLVAEPPDVILSVVEQIEPLLWLGFAQNLYSKSQLRLNLTRHCQVCGYTGLNAEDLRLHMHAIHPVHLQESQYLIEMFNWCMFMEMGCFCNPSPGWGELHHECVGLTQLALIAASYGWQVVLPWPFTSQDLIGLLGNLLPCSALQRITMALMTRNFHQLWEDTELLTMLATHCLVYQEPVAMSHIQAHLVVAHQITNDRLKYVTHQLSAVFDQISMAEERCDWCHELLHTYLDADDVMQVDVHAHLQKCPMITQLAMLLMHPRWSVPALQPLTWATQERICENRRKHELKLWQFNVSTSDTYGQSLEPASEGIDSAMRIWGNLLTKEQMNNLGITPPVHRDKGREGKRPRTDRKTDRKDRSASESTTTVPTEVLGTLCRLVLRHEDTINSLLQKSQFIVHLATGPGSVLPLLMDASRTWHQQETKPIPLRHLLVQTMVQELERRLKTLMEATPTAELFQDCKSYHLVKDDTNRSMPFLRWSHQRKCLEPTEQACLPINEVHRSLQNILRLLADHRVTLRFHSLKKVQDTKENQQAVPWIWTVAQRHDPELWHEVAKLAYHSSWQLIQVRLRPQGLDRTPLAKQIQKMMCFCRAAEEVGHQIILTLDRTMQNEDPTQFRSFSTLTRTGEEEQTAEEQTLGYWWHSIPARAGTHGLCTVICCEASDTPQLDFAQLRHWPHWICKLLHIFCVVLLIQQFQMTDQTWSGGEGCVLSTEDTEAPETWETALINQLGAKQRGFRPTNCFGNSWPQLDSVKKRSLKRAYTRALRDGSCWYKGQCYTAQHFAGVPAPSSQRLPATRAQGFHNHTQCNLRHQSRKYLRYLSWNGGGMSAHRLEEVKQWCRCQCIDILVLTETRWQFSNEWMDNHWISLHTGVTSTVDYHSREDMLAVMPLSGTPRCVLALLILMKASISMQQRDQGRQAFLTSSPAWQAFMDASAAVIQQHLTQVDPLDPTMIPELHRITSAVYVQHFPCHVQQRETLPDEAGRSLIMDKWRHRDCWKKLLLPSARNILRAWFHMTRFKLLRKEHRRHAYAARQQRFDAILDQAQTAANQHDSYQLFRVINRFSPKTSKRRLQLRNVHGNLATPTEERAMLHAFVAKTWSGPETVPRLFPATTGLPFDQDALLKALEQIPISKAVARPFTPGLIWKSHANLLAPPLFRILQQLWDCPEPRVPACWRDAWLILIPKPLKAACSPDALRPLALQEPIGLSRILYYFGIIMEVLQDKGLVINTTKSAVILTMGGTNFRQARSTLTFFNRDGEWIEIKGRAKTFTLPVVKQTKYLGAMVSYMQFEDATVKYRVGLAKVAFARLKKWLTARRGLIAQSRLRLWSTCVYPILTYGIFTIGLTRQCLQMLQTTMITMLRQIHHDHAYNTGRTHTQALHFHGLDHPLLWLWRAADTLLLSATKQRLPCVPHDICNQLDWSPVQAAKDLIATVHDSGLLVPDNMIPSAEVATDMIFQCQHCSFRASSLSVLRRHCTQVHGNARYRRFVPQVSQYMHQGLPVCMQCGLSFTTWRRFIIHVQRGCQAASMEARTARPIAPFADSANPPTGSSEGVTTLLTSADIDTIQKLEFGPRLLTLIKHRRWPELLRERASCLYLSRHCLLCGQYVGRAQAMHHHVRAVHRAAIDQVQTKATQLTNLHSDESPCTACGVTFIYGHSCNVWFQVALLIVHGPRMTATSTTELPVHLQCEICGTTCETSQELHAHLRQEHRLVSSVWQESRDSFQGDPVCNHCHLLFQTMAGLRSHINQGRCEKFDPDLSSTPSPVLDIWREACCQGAFEQVLQSSHNKLRLTLQCQCCPKRYTRAADLSAHIQGSHAEIWSAAQSLVHQMVQRYYGTLGCVCNPSCNVNRLHHICLPFWQLAMQFVRLPNAIYMPACQRTTEIARVLPPHVPADQRETLEQALGRYDLTMVWTDSLLLDTLSGSCLLCGLDMLPAELYYHLHEMENDGAVQQMLQSFQNLVLPLDPNLKLQPNPGASKKQRRLPAEEANGRAPPPGHRQEQAQDQRKILEMMARLLLRVDRDLQVLQRETTFIFYFSCNEDTGVLPQLLQAADKWHKDMQEGASSSKMPLRQVLLQTVIHTLATRVTKLLEAQEDSPLMQAARKSHILLENKTVPFMEWNGHEQRLQISSKTPVSLTKMSQHCTELMDSFSNANLIMKFHSLPTKQGSLVTPWRLQMSCREDRTYELLAHLAQSQIWTLLAASLKLHNQHQSSLATNIEISLGLKPNKGQGKGKTRHKGKAMKELKTEA